MRYLFERFHILLGLFAAIPISLQGLSGAFLVFEEEIDQWLNSDSAYVEPVGERLSLERQIEEFARQRPEMIEHVYAVRLPQTEIDATQMLAKPAKEVGPRRGIRFRVNPYTGEILSGQNYRDTLTGQVYDFHRTFWLPPWGAWITSTSALILAAVAITGFVLALMRWRKGSTTTAFGWHHRLSIWFAPIVFVIALNGAAITYYFVLQPVIFYLTDTSLAESMRRGGLSIDEPASGVQRKSLDELVGLAVEQAPEAEPRVILAPRTTGRPVTIVSKMPHEPRATGGMFQTFHPYTGERLEKIDFTDGELGNRVLYWKLHLHKGTWGGLLGGPTGSLLSRMLWLVAAAAVPLLVLSGIWTWTTRRNLRASNPIRMRFPRRNSF